MNRGVFLRQMGGAAVAFLLSGCLAAGGPSKCDLGKGAWEKKADLGVSRIFPGVQLVNGKVVIFGGFTRISNSPRLVSDVEEYDPKTNQVTKKADMPVARSFFGSVVIGQEIYIIGGYEGNGPSSRVEAYDPVHEKWTNKAPLNVARPGLRAALVGNQIFAFGGFGDLGKVFEVYDIKKDAWTRLGDLPHPVLNPGVAVYNGKIYVFGGGIPDGTKAAGFVQVYNPVTSKWSFLGTMPVPKGDIVVGVRNARAYIVGGWNDVPLKRIDVFDFEKKTWSLMPDMAEDRFNGGGVMIDGKLYMIAGAKAEPIVASAYVNTIDTYDASVEEADCGRSKAH